jgi:hypothetical protein
MPFAQRLNVKSRFWRKLFKEVVESSQPSAGQKWSKLEPGRSKLEEDPKLETRAFVDEITEDPIRANYNAYFLQKFWCNNNISLVRQIVVNASNHIT